jgi:hypothetical protein
MQVLYDMAQPKQEQRNVSEQQGEPVAWMNSKRDMTYIHGPYNADDIPLYTTQQQRKPLTREVIDRDFHGRVDFVRQVEAAHGITKETP